MRKQQELKKKLLKLVKGNRPIVIACLKAIKEIRAIEVEERHWERKEKLSGIKNLYLKNDREDLWNDFYWDDRERNRVNYYTREYGEDLGHVMRNLRTAIKKVKAK